MMNLLKHQIKHFPLILNITFLLNLKVYAYFESISQNIQKININIKKPQFILTNHQRQTQMIYGQQTKRVFLTYQIRNL